MLVLLQTCMHLLNRRSRPAPLHPARCRPACSPLRVEILEDRLALSTVVSTANGGPWSFPSTWVGNVVPGRYDDVTIATTGNHSVFLDVPASISSMGIQPGATLDGGFETLTLFGGGLVNNGGTLFGHQGTPTFAYDRMFDYEYLVVRLGTNTLNNLSHPGTASLRVSGNSLSIGGTFSNNGGTFDTLNNAITVAGLATLSVGAYLAGAATQSFNGGLRISGAAFMGSTGTVNTADLTISSGTLVAKMWVKLADFAAVSDLTVPRSCRYRSVIGTRTSPGPAAESQTWDAWARVSP